MELRKFAPDIRLSQIIRFYWFLDSESDLPEFKRIMPFGAMDIILHKETPMSLKRGVSTPFEPMAFVEGQYLRYQYKMLNERTSLIGISIYPWASTLLFGSPAVEFTGEIVALDCFHQKRFEALIELSESDQVSEKIVSELDKFFINEIGQKDRMIDQELRSFSQELQTQNELPISEVISNEWGRSTRTLQIKFKENFGLTLNEFRRKYRFQKAMELMNNGNKSLTSTALEAGFYDQSHFTRTFRSFAGLSPSAYLNEQPDSGETMMGDLLS